MIVPFSFILERPWTLDPGAPELASIAVPGLGATAAAQLILLKVVALRGASFLAMNNYLVPLFGVAWGTLFLGRATERRRVGGARADPDRGDRVPVSFPGRDEARGRPRARRLTRPPPTAQQAAGNRRFVIVEIVVEAPFGEMHLHVKGRDPTGSPACTVHGVAVHGSTSAIPVSTKCRVLRVTSVARRALAVAAI